MDGTRKSRNNSVQLKEAGTIVLNSGYNNRQRIISQDDILSASGFNKDLVKMPNPIKDPLTNTPNQQVVPLTFTNVPDQQIPLQLQDNKSVVSKHQNTNNPVMPIEQQMVLMDQLSKRLLQSNIRNVQTQQARQIPYNQQNAPSIMYTNENQQVKRPNGSQMSDRAQQIYRQQFPTQNYNIDPFQQQNLQYQYPQTNFNNPGTQNDGNQYKDEYTRQQLMKQSQMIEQLIKNQQNSLQIPTYHPDIRLDSSKSRGRDQQVQFPRYSQLPNHTPPFQQNDIMANGFNFQMYQQFQNLRDDFRDYKKEVEIKDLQKQIQQMQYAQLQNQIQHQQKNSSSDNTMQQQLMQQQLQQQAEKYQQQMLEMQRQLQLSQLQPQQQNNQPTAEQIQQMVQQKLQDAERDNALKRQQEELQRLKEQQLLEQQKLLAQNQNMGNQELMRQLELQRLQHEMQQKQLTNDQQLSMAQKDQIQPKPIKKVMDYQKIKKFRAAVFTVDTALYMNRQNKIREYKRMEEYQEDYHGLLQEASIPAVEWLKFTLDDFANNIKDVSNMDITSEKAKKLKESDIQTRVDKYAVMLNQIMDYFIKYATDEKVPQILSFFLDLAYTDQKYLPKGYMFQFEIDRMSFNPNVGYLEQLDQKQKWLLNSFFLIVRLFIGNVLVRPQDFQSNKDKLIPDTENTKGILKTIASILYHFLMDYFTEQCPVIEDNISRIKEEKFRTTAIKETLPIKFDKSQQVVSENNTKINVITGLFSKDELSLFFDNKKSIKWLEKYVEKFEEFMKKLNDIIDSVDDIVYSKKKNEMVKNNRDKIMNDSNLPKRIKKMKKQIKLK